MIKFQDNQPISNANTYEHSQENNEIIEKNTCNKFDREKQNARNRYIPGKSVDRPED